MREPSSSYQAVHARVVRMKGKAKTHSCSHCGKTADHWAYDHLDPRPLKAAVGRHKKLAEYSADTRHYLALCCTCHARFDVKRTKKV